MLALAFSFSAFLYWALLGRAVVALAYPRLGVLRSALLAPGIGLAVVLLGLMALNQAGVPIRQAALPMTLVFGAAAGIVILWRRPVTPWRKGGAFLASAVFGLFWAGWPAIEAGFNWLSYANDDMANYCLAAQRFMDHGFYDVPTMEDLAGRDYAAYYYFMHVADMMRFGAEHLVAWSASLLGLQATQVFMPTILALSLVQITAVGGLVLHTGRWRRHALVAMWLLAASPLFLLGTLYQLIAQVGGVALLLVVVALLTRTWISTRRRALLRYAVLPALVSAALCIYYPEVTPFAGMSVILYALLWAARNRAFPAAIALLAVYTLVGVFVLLRYNLISYVSILVIQSAGAMHAANLLLSLFPYFMIPTGFSNLFGWMPIAHDFPEPVVSLSIAAGMILVTAILARAVRDAWRLTPAAILLLIEFAFAVKLFTAANDFGLYKIAMWMQPVLMAGFAGWVLWAARGRRALAGAAVVLFIASGTATAYYYTDASRGMKSGGLTELRLATQLGLKADLVQDKEAHYTSTIENVVAAKLAASVTRGHWLALPSRDYFFPTTRHDYRNPTLPIRVHPHFDEMAPSVPLIERRNSSLITRGTLWETQFSQPVINRPTDYYFSLDRRLSLFNKLHLGSIPEGRKGVFVVEPAAAIRNRLMFVHSALGNHYYLGDRRKISFFQQEQDPYSPGHDFSGIGRFMLMRVENPSPKVYLRIAATRTMLTGRTEWKPDAEVRSGDGVDVPIGLVGSGAFNLYVGPLTPQTFNGAHYLSIDFRETPQRVVDFRSGLKRLYSNQVPLDYRLLLGWARDISAVSEEEYAAMRRPRAVSKFPDDLALAEELEFAGAYEDGWLSPHSKFVFAGARPGELIRLRGMVPAIPGSPLGTGSLRVTINGADVCTVPVPTGTFDWLLPVPNPAEVATRVELQFSAWTPLPGRDQRPTGAKLEYLGFSGSTTMASDYNDRATPKMIAPGIDHDGWMTQTASLVLPPSTHARKVIIRTDRLVAGAKPGVLRAALDGTEISQTADLATEKPVTLQLQVPASDQLRTIHLTGPAELPLAAPDTRKRSLRVLHIEVAPVSSR